MQMLELPSVIARKVRPEDNFPLFSIYKIRTHFIDTSTYEIVENVFSLPAGYTVHNRFHEIQQGDQTVWPIKAIKFGDSFDNSCM